MAQAKVPTTAASAELVRRCPRGTFPFPNENGARNEE